MCLGGTNLPKAVGGFLFIFMNVHACSINRREKIHVTLIDDFFRFTCIFDVKLM